MGLFDVFKKKQEVAQVIEQKTEHKINSPKLVDKVGVKFRVIIERKSGHDIYADFNSDSMKHAMHLYDNASLIKDKLLNFASKLTLQIPKTSDGTVLIVPTSEIRSLRFTELPGNPIKVTELGSVGFFGTSAEAKAEENRLISEYEKQVKEYLSKAVP